MDFHGWQGSQGLAQSFGVHAEGFFAGFAEDHLGGHAGHGDGRLAAEALETGFVDDLLISLDPLTVQREHEHAFLGGDDFPRLLAANNVTLG